MSVKRCKQEVDSKEFTRWLAMYSVEPFGAPVEKVRHAELLATVCNASQNIKKRGGGMFKPEDFIDDEWERARKRSPEYQRQMIERFLAKSKPLLRKQDG